VKIIMMLITNLANAEMATIHGNANGNPDVGKRFPPIDWRGILFLIFFLCLKHFPLQAGTDVPPATAILSSLSCAEQQRIRLFFYNIFARHELGYTLFGDKPMSICWPDTLSPRFSKLDFTFKLYIDGTIPLSKALAAWNKIKNNTEKSNYSLIVCEENKYPSFTILINKKTFSEQFNKNKDLFKKYYKKNITADVIISNLENKQSYHSIFQEPLFRNDLLLGIMLGFGKHSAELFQRRVELMSEDIPPPFLQNKKIPSKGFLSIEEELRDIARRMQAQPKTFEWYTHTFPLFLRITTVTFAFDPDDPEAQALINKYKATHAQLTEIFDRGEWLDLVLEKLYSSEQTQPKKLDIDS
jgi:hypothetical protein